MSELHHSFPAIWPGWFVPKTAKIAHLSRLMNFGKAGLDLIALSLNLPIPLQSIHVQQ